MSLRNEPFLFFADFRIGDQQSCALFLYNKIVRGTQNVLPARIILWGICCGVSTKLQWRVIIRARKMLRTYGYSEGRQ